MLSNGIVFINKEKGYTSQDVVAIVKKTLQLRAGHAGTLDPNAEGLLIVCVGRATKLSNLLMEGDKTYIAEVMLGITTDTYDNTGEVLTQQNVAVSEQDIVETVAGFIGEQDQVPPMYSAIKINGKKLYELAREGKTVERASRRVVIQDIKILDINMKANVFTIEVNCSKGTYIRSLCADIGAKLECGACMGNLTRTRSGSFSIEDAVTLAQLKENPEAYIWDVEKAFPFPRAYAQPNAENLAFGGHPFAPSKLAYTELGHERYWLYYSDQLIGLYKKINGRFMLEARMACTR